MILENKIVLFGAFSSCLTKQDKRQKWQEITDMCHSLGVIPAAKEYTYVRDTYWPNIKKATMAKIDNAKKTGSAGGKDKKLTAVDELVLEILGKGSPTVVGLNMPDTMQDEIQYQAIVSDLTSTDLVIDPNPTISLSLATSSANQCVDSNENNIRRRADTRRTIVKYGSRRHAEFQEYNELKKRKLEEDLKTTRLQNYKLELDIYEQEIRLNIVQSNFTQHILTRDPILTSPQYDD